MFCYSPSQTAQRVSNQSNDWGHNPDPETYKLWRFGNAMSSIGIVFLAITLRAVVNEWQDY